MDLLKLFGMDKEKFSQMQQAAIAMLKTIDGIDKKTNGIEQINKRLDAIEEALNQKGGKK